MKEIKKIKHDGGVRALSNQVDSLIFDLTHQNWNGIKENVYFCRLGEAIKDAESILRQMSKILKALQKLEPDNR